MHIGVPLETQTGETRVAATPETIKKLISQGHKVTVQTGAGVKASVVDSAYEAAGATIGSANDAFGAELILKVVAPSDAELAQLKAQVESLQAKISELEERTDAQSGVNVDTAAQLDKLNAGGAKVETKGGIKVTSADKKFEASIGGRIHFDAYAFDRDQANTTGTTDLAKRPAAIASAARCCER